jgi:hypothetical protein
VGYASAAQAPEWFTTAPAVAIDRVTKKLGLSPRDIDLYEINEAFAVVAMVCAKLCNIDLDKVNVRGGAVALGHPDRRERRAHPDDAPARHEGPRREAWARDAVHRRRGSRGGRRRARAVSARDFRECGEGMLA